MKLASPHRASTSLPAGLALLALGLLAGVPARGAETHALDDTGRLVTVGNWRMIRDDDGSALRLADANALGWELRDAATVVGQGDVPGTADRYRDASPSVSRNPVNGEILLVWSRESAAGPLELVASTWRDGSFVDETPRVLASGPTDQTDATVLHDAAGQAFVAWRDGDDGPRVNLLILDEAGRELSHQDLSSDVSLSSGAPLLGVDETGQIFVAFAGVDTLTSEQRVFVLAARTNGGGVLHDPMPILDLALWNAQPLPESLGSPSSEPVLPALRASVLGGTAVVWWTERDEFGRLVFRHLAKSAETGWSNADIGTFVLDEDTPDAVQQALQVLENRLRRVVVSAGGSSAAPRLRRTALSLP